MILDGNHWIENYNLMAFPLQKVPKSHSNGWRSVRKNKSTHERVWSLRKDAWRSSEPRKDAVHYSDDTMGKILSDVRIFLRELLVEVQGKKQKEEQKDHVPSLTSHEIGYNNNNPPTPDCSIIYEDISSSEECFDDSGEPKDMEYDVLFEPDFQDLNL